MTKRAPPNNQLPSYTATSVRNGLIAGYAAGTCGIVVGHPLDSIKVLLQTNGVGMSTRNATNASTGPATQPQQGHPKSSGGNAETAMTRAAAQSSQTISSSNFGASSSKANVSTVATKETSRFKSNSVIGKRSLRALYAGVTGPLLTAGLLRSLDFAIYDSARRALYQRQLQSEYSNGTTTHGHNDDYLHYDNLSNVAIASFATGAATSMITSPLAVIKTKQQIMVWGFRKAVLETYHSGSLNNARPNVLKGLQNFYTGFGLHFFCFAFGGSVYFTTYEMAKRKFAQNKINDQTSAIFNNKVSTQNLPLSERMISAAIAGTTCWAAIFPADVIRSRLYAQSLGHQSSSMQLNGFELARQMVKEQGVRSLYRGMGVTVARAGPVAAAVLPVYDSVLAWLSS